MLAGGLVGYLSYEFNVVIAATRRAWREVTSWCFDSELSKRDFWLFFWNFNAAITIVTALIMFFTSVAVGILLLAETGTEEMMPGLIKLRENWDSVVLGVTFIILIVALIPYAAEKNDDWSDGFDEIKRFNPFSVYCYYLPLGLWWCLKKTPFVLLLAAKGLKLLIILAALFIARVFVLIHSDIRLLCMIDAMIGTAVGHFMGSAVIGMLAGGIVGVLNYVIVSRRILHLDFSPVKTA